MAGSPSHPRLPEVGEPSSVVATYLLDDISPLSQLASVSPISTGLFGGRELICPLLLISDLVKHLACKTHFIHEGRELLARLPILDFPGKPPSLCQSVSANMKRGGGIDGL